MVSDKVILTLQVSGFAAAAVALCFTGAPHWIFVAAFAVHFIGDVMFLAKEGMPNMFTKIASIIKSYIIPAPWAEFVGHMLMLAALVGFLTGHPAAFWIAVAAFTLSSLAYAYRYVKKMLSQRDAAFRVKLHIPALLAVAIGTLLLRFVPHVGVWFAFVGTGVNMADFCYDLIYP